MCSSTFWNGLFHRLPTNDLFRCSIRRRILYDLSALLPLSLLEKWRFCKMDWNLALVMTFWIFSFPIHLSVDQYCSEDGNLLIPIIKFIQRNPFISPSVVSKLQTFCVAYLFFFVTMICRSSFIPVTVWIMSKVVELWSRSTSTPASKVDSFYIICFFYLPISIPWL